MNNTIDDNHVKVEIIRYSIDRYIKAQQSSVLDRDMYQHYNTLIKEEELRLDKFRSTNPEFFI